MPLQRSWQKKGCFPLWDKSVFTRKQDAGTQPAYHCPTGSVTTMAGCEGYGVEPIFAVAYTKSTNVAGDLKVFSPLFLESIKGYDIPEKRWLPLQKGSCQGMSGIPAEVAGIFKGAGNCSDRPPPDAGGGTKTCGQRGVKDNKPA